MHFLQQLLAEGRAALFLDHARPEELPESTKLAQKLRALQVDVVKVLAEWFRESGALTEEEVGAIPRRFQRFADRSRRTVSTTSLSVKPMPRDISARQRDPSTGPNGP